jgi:perosamine synthetase
MIPVCEPVIGEPEVESVTQCLAKGWVSAFGEPVSEFERTWASYCGARHGIAVSSGTAALQVAVEALDLGRGDEVILPSFTIISCALAIVRAGATPVVVDCDPETYCLDPQLVRAAVTDKTRAIMVVHMYGHPADMDPLHQLASEYGLAIVEDAAQAHGAEYLSRADAGGGWRPTGNLGTVGAFSFFANKLVTTGEGGMVLTDSDEIAERCRRLRNLDMGPRRFHHERLAYNFRLTSMQAALGLAQIERLPSTLGKKREIARYYRELLADVAGVLPSAVRPWARSNFWMNALVLDDDVGIDAFELGRRLADVGVETRPYFKGIHEQPAFTAAGLFEGVELPITERLHRRGLYLPSGAALTHADIENVVASVRSCLA